MIPQIRQFDISDTGDGQVAANYWVLRLHTNNSKNKKWKLKSLEWLLLFGPHLG